MFERLKKIARLAGHEPLNASPSTFADAQSVALLFDHKRHLCLPGGSKLLVGQKLILNSATAELRLEVVDRLGGVGGTVLLTREDVSGKLWALKLHAAVRGELSAVEENNDIDLSRSNVTLDLRRFLRERSVLRMLRSVEVSSPGLPTVHFPSLSHSFILRRTDANDVRTMGALVMEYLPGMSFADYFKDHSAAPESIDVGEVLRISRATLKGLRYLSSRGIFNTDFHMGNVHLLTSSHGPVNSIALIDFAQVALPNSKNKQSDQGYAHEVFWRGRIHDDTMRGEAPEVFVSAKFAYTLRDGLAPFLRYSPRLQRLSVDLKRGEESGMNLSDLEALLSS